MIWRYRLAAALLIFGAAVLRLVYLVNDCPLDLAPDEAHYWDWSRHLDWSYYSKGPLVAWIIRLSCWLLGPLSVELTGTEMLAVRIPAVFFGSLLLVSLYVLTVQVWRHEGLALAVVALALTMPLIAAGSLLMTIDSPYTCLWGWGLAVGHRALFGRGTPSAPVLRTGAKQIAWEWPVLGLLVGVGVLAKYTMVLFVPFLALFLLASPDQRRLLMRPGFWMMSLTAALCCLPILIWNAQHDWITLQHARGHAGLQSSRVIQWEGPLRYLALQFAILLGFWFVVWALAMWTHRPGQERRPHVAFLWWLSAPMFLFFGVFSLKNGGGEPNWPVTAYLAGLVLAAGSLAEQWPTRSLAWRRWTLGAACGFACLGLMLTVAMHQVSWVQPVLARIAGKATSERPLPLRRVDPTARLQGWQTLAKAVDEIRRDLRQQGIEAVLAGGAWILPGEMGFYCIDHPTVYTFGSALGDRHSQYDLWHPNPVSDARDFLGKTFIIVGIEERMLAGAFDRLEPQREVTHLAHGQPLNRWPVIVGHGFRGFRHLGNGTTY